MRRILLFGKRPKPLPFPLAPLGRTALRKLGLHGDANKPLFFFLRQLVVTYADLVAIRKQGCGKPNRIYPKSYETVSFTESLKSDYGTPEG